MPALRRSHLATLLALGLLPHLPLAAQPAPLAPPPQDYVAAIGASPLKAPLTADFSPGAYFTIEAWVFPPASAVNDGWLAGKVLGAPGVDPFLSFGLQLKSDRRVDFSYSTGAPGSFRSVASDVPIAPRRWTHVAAVMDGTSTRIYLNGTLSASGTALGPPPAPAAVPFSVGLGLRADGGVNYHPFEGYARQVRLWSIARTAAQIAAAAGEASPSDPVGLVGAWPLDDPPESRVIRDLSGGNRALTTAGLSSIRTVLLSMDPFYAVTRTTRNDPDSRYLHQGVLIDFDGDGDLDSVFAQINYSQASGGTPSRVRAFRNNHGSFVDVTDAVLGHVTLVHPRHQLVGDFNGDGRSDALFVGHGYDYSPFPGEQSRLLIQTPDGRLVEDPARLPSGIKFTHNVAAADIDRDGDLDLYFCNVATGALGPRLYLNDGRGFFTENGSRLPAEILDGTFDRFTASHFVDVNRDGWPDLVLGALQGFRPGQGFPNQLLMNDGTGRFVRDPRFVLPPKLVDLSATVVNIESADFNGDGWPDLVLSTDDWLVTPPNGVRVGAAIQLLLNRGDGTFRDVSATSGIVMTPREVWTEWMFPVDFTGDGRPDLILQTSPSSGSRMRFLENVGGDPVRFRDLTEFFNHFTTSPLALLLPGDIDRDGRLDLLGVAGNQIDFARNVLPFTEGRLANLSVRTQAGTGDATLIAGFALGGSGAAPAATKPLLVRAIGPTLGAFGVTGTLADPAIEIAPLGAARMAANDNWAGTTALKNAFAAVGAFALADDASRDAALVFAPTVGAYTATVSGGSGIALVEVYDAGAGNTPRLTNVSARTQVGTGADALIAGFVVNGTLPKRLLLRAIGPTLAAFGVGGTLADPVLTLRPLGSETIVATNDDWAGTAALKTAFASVGAFAFANDASKDAALVLDLPPGAYTATVSGKNTTTGVALVEVYELP